MFYFCRIFARRCLFLMRSSANTRKTFTPYHHLIIMGRTKWSSESDSGNTYKQPAHRLSVSRPTRRGVAGRRFLADLKEVPLRLLPGFLWIRVQRQWWALRFRLRMPEGRKGILLKVGTLAAIAWLMLFTRWLPWSWVPDGTHFTSEQLLSGGHGTGGTSLFKTKRTNLPANEAAPVSKGQLTPEMAAAYIEQYAALARTEMHKYGVPASISLAQGLVESRAGDSKLARSNNNHFGIKCFSRRCKKGHCSNFTDDTHKDFFRIFRQPADSWRAHSIMLTTGRYARLKQHGRDYRKWAYGLKSIGYATDATYAEKLIGMIDAYQLHRFDQ